MSYKVITKYYAICQHCGKEAETDRPGTCGDTPPGWYKTDGSILIVFRPEKLLGANDIDLPREEATIGKNNEYIHACSSECLEEILKVPRFT